MPAGDDPDTFLKAHGEAAFRTLLSNAKEFFDFKLERAKANGLLNSASERTSILTECAEMLSLFTDPAALDSQLNIVAIHLQSSRNALREAINQVRSKPKRAPRELASTEDTVEGATKVPTPIHDIISYLCYLSLTSSVAQRYLSEQFESLHEALPWFDGVGLLEYILGKAPDPGTPAAVNTFLGGLNEQDRMALASILAAPRYHPLVAHLTEDPLQAAERSLALLSGIVLERRDSAVKAALKRTDLPSDEMFELIKEAKEIAILLKGIAHRTERDEELPAATARPKTPYWKNEFRR
jgi:DNA primase